MMELGTFYHQIEAGVHENGFTLNKAMEKMRAHGITKADVSSHYLCTETPEIFSQRLSYYGIDIESVHGLIGCDVKSEALLIKSIDEMKRLIELSKRAGSKYFMMVPQPSDSNTHEQYPDFKDGVRMLFEECTRFANEVGIIPTIENFSKKDIPYTTYEEIKEYLDNISGLYYTYDSGNFVLAGLDELEGARIFINKTVYVHLKDIVTADYETDCLRNGVYYDFPALDDGMVRNRDAVRFLIENGYDGVFTFEMGSEGDIFNKTLVSADRYREFIRG